MKLPSILGIRGARDNPKTAMEVRRILSEAVASLPIYVYRYTDTGKERIYEHPLYYLLHDEPNLEMTLACEEYGASFFENGTTPGGVLKKGMKYQKIEIPPHMFGNLYKSSFSNFLRQSFFLIFPQGKNPLG